MSVRKFILPLSSSASGEVALHMALMMAKLWNAHLVVLHVQTDLRDVAPMAGEGLSGAMIEQMMSSSEREGAKRAQSLRELFSHAAEAHGVMVGNAMVGNNEPSAVFTIMAGREEEIIAYQARISDLVIVPHPSAGEDVASADALHAVLFDSGRPVLMAPFEPPRSIGKRIAVAWNGMSNAASALASTMPLIRQAEAVCVLTAPEYFRRGPAAEEVVNYIAYHGVESKVITFRPIDRDVGAGLLAAAAGFEADLMCMGAYSTSRIRQLILGGVTSHVLENATLPVLMNR